MVRSCGTGESQGAAQGFRDPSTDRKVPSVQEGSRRLSALLSGVSQGLLKAEASLPGVGHAFTPPRSPLRAPPATGAAHAAPADRAPDEAAQRSAEPHDLQARAASASRSLFTTNSVPIDNPGEPGCPACHPLLSCCISSGSSKP